ncbi:hypothetical protein [Microbacterium binotii]|uniref:hypothetical protein n=1 Tax=Microbacterium binotii TaxID=462710 RepID=UPI001F2DCA63|nr:hypothetical protein [Microbacterium binotii]UIN31657.1 hypothetical protein LXM64_05535 [Microbacterium binotii]
MTEPDDSTRLSRREPGATDQPEDSTQLVSRRDRRNASAAAEATDATAIVSRETPAPPVDETVIVDRSPTAATVTAADVEDRTALVRRPAEAEAPSPEEAPPSDELEDGTLLVRRPAPPTDATVVVARSLPTPAAHAEDEDEHTILTPRSPASVDPLDEDDTVLRPRDEPQDATLLRRRDRPTDADADDTVLRPRDAVADDATSLSLRGATAGASPRLTRARRGAARQTTSFAPDAETDRTPARERYAIRTPTITSAPATAAASPVVDIGDGGLAARIARRRATRTRLTVLAGVSAVVFVGSIVGLATLLSI